MTATYQERPRKGGGTQACLNHSHEGWNEWRRLLPIVLTADEAQKVHAGEKTQARALVNPQPPVTHLMREHSGHGIFWSEDGIKTVFAPQRFRVGDVLFVKEPWRTDTEHDCLMPRELPPHARIRFEGDGQAECGDCGKLRPGRFLPLRFARPERYQVTGVRCERVNGISDADALAEGCAQEMDRLNGRVMFYARENFILLWNSTHDKPGTRFEDAPWVFCYELKKVRP